MRKTKIQHVHKRQTSFLDSQEIPYLGLCHMAHLL